MKLTSLRKELFVATSALASFTFSPSLRGATTAPTTSPTEPKTFVITADEMREYQKQMGILRNTAFSEKLERERLQIDYQAYWWRDTMITAVLGCFAGLAVGRWYYKPRTNPDSQSKTL